MNRIPFRVSDESYTLVEPNLHDGRLVGIGIPEDGAIELAVVDSSAERYRITLNEVAEFCATDFRSGNIILDITIARGEAVQISDLVSLGHPGQDQRQRHDHLQAVHERILRDSLYVLEINPSYGCHLIGVAKSVSVSRGS